MSAGLRSAVVLALFATTMAPAIASEPIVFTAEERGRILSHGPWPPPLQPDPSNRVSGNAAAQRFGRALFFDEGLSRFGALACASCHKPDKAWGDGRAKASAAASLDRNTPPLFNLRFNRWFGWDGGADSLWMQSLRPILDPREMGASAEHVREHIAATREHRTAYRRLFGAAPARQTPDRVLANIAKVLAAFQETIVTRATPFDEYRDALAKGDPAGMARYPDTAQRGLKLFVGRGQCSACHAGPTFTNGEFHDTGLGFFAGPGRVDTGRHGGLEKLKASPYNLLGSFNDDRRRRTAWTTRHVAPQHRNFGEFKVPSLRNVALTGPYMHNGSKAALADVVRH